MFQHGFMIKFLGFLQRGSVLEGAEFVRTAGMRLSWNVVTIGRFTMLPGS